MALLACCYGLTCIVVFLTDPFAMPRHVCAKHRVPRGPKRLVVENLARLPIIFLVFAGFFAISWRPVYAAQATMSFFIIFTGISRAKFIFIREPLVFSDIALVVDVFKYKTIFYATSLNVVFWIVALGYVFGVSGLYYYFEPHILPEVNRRLWIIVGLAVAFGPWLLLFYKRVNRPLFYFSERLLQKLNVRANTVRFGTFASVVYHFVVWLGPKREKIVSELKQSVQHALHELTSFMDADGDSAAPLVVIWQSESFLDLRHFGVKGLELPHIDQLKRSAVQWGRMTNVFEGGYTLRTEFAVLSGIQPDDAYADASYPYLRASHYADVVWPTRLKKAGWSTHFIHPYDRTFFLRDKAMPILGFESMTMLDAFSHKPERDGLYVSDRKLTEKVLDITEKLDEETPALLFVASMANHGPWEPGRCGSLADPVEIYMELLRKADAALGHLVARLNRLDRPVWLAFYGDHAPLLKSFADPFPDPRTDYFIVPLAAARGERKAPVPPSEEAPWNLFQALFSHAPFFKQRAQ